MRSFIDYIRNENLIENLIETYNKKFNNENEKELLIKLCDMIYSFKDEGLFNSPYQNNDIFGKIYERSVNHEERKILGEFYTPLPVVDYILDSIGYNAELNVEDKKIIDISCGSGSFIIQVIRIFIRCFMRIHNRSAVTDFTVEEAKKLILTVNENIFGVDINPIACILCQLNIQFVLFEIFKFIRNSDKNYRLPDFNVKVINALKLVNTEKYDYIVGNPPYLFIRDIPNEQRKIIEEGDFETNDGQYDYYQIFIELGIKLLKDHGKLGYIVPDSILALSNRSIIRKYIYNTTKIKEIYYTGPKFDEPVVSNIILILEKESDNLEREKNNIKIKLSDKQEKQIVQESLKNWDYKFLIHLTETDIPIIEYLNKDFPKLRDLNQKEGFKISISRGVELAKTGEIVYCEKCELYFPVPKKYFNCPECRSQLKMEHKENIIYEGIPENKKKDIKSFIYSINRYQIKDNKYIDISKNGINYKNLDIYEDRIIIRQLSQNNLICATYDNNLSLTSQSFYNLKIVSSPIAEFNNLFLLGIINSKLLSYYFIKSFGSYKKLFPRILIEKIKDLPFKVPETDEEKDLAVNIINNVKALLESYDKNIQNQIDSLVFDIYKISNDKREYILKFMEK